MGLNFKLKTFYVTIILLDLQKCYVFYLVIMTENLLRRKSWTFSREGMATSCVFMRETLLQGHLLSPTLQQP